MLEVAEARHNLCPAIATNATGLLETIEESTVQAVREQMGEDEVARKAIPAMRL